MDEIFQDENNNSYNREEITPKAANIVLQGSTVKDQPASAIKSGNAHTVKLFNESEQKEAPWIKSGAKKDKNIE